METRTRRVTAVEALTPRPSMVARYRWLAVRAPPPASVVPAVMSTRPGEVSETQVAVPLRRRNSHAAPPVMVCPAERLTT